MQCTLSKQVSFNTVNKVQRYQFELLNNSSIALKNHRIQFIDSLRKFALNYLHFSKQKYHELKHRATQHAVFGNVFLNIERLVTKRSFYRQHFDFSIYIIHLFSFTRFKMLYDVPTTFIITCSKHDSRKYFHHLSQLLHFILKQVT